jgi:dihydroorotase
MLRLAVLSLLVLSASAQTYDLILKGGHVIDPRNNIDAVRDVAVQGGKVAAIGVNLSGARRTLDVRGLYVTPGLIDLHVHVFYNSAIPGVWAGDFSVPPDSHSFRTGVTTMVDAGSSGYRNFEQFRANVINRSRTRVLAMINVAGFGMMTDHVEQDTADMLPAKIVEVAKRNQDVVVAIKAAHYQKPDWTSVDRALEAAKQLNVPVMVDFGYFLPERPFWQLVTQRLRPGDIATHAFRGPVPWVDKNGKLYPYLYEARKRGVRFDVGHGGGSFVMRNGAPAIAQGFYPDSISTDLHTGSMVGAMIDMPTTMSKLMALGLPLKEAILESTWNPAQMIKRTDLGHLSVGATADIAVWNLMKGDFGYRDNEGGMVKGKERLFCELTLMGGAVVWDWNARTGVDYRTLKPDYGVREVETIVPPPAR